MGKVRWTTEAAHWLQDVHDQPGHHIRILLHGHYRIAYLIKQDGDVDILGVFHGAMELDRYL